MELTILMPCLNEVETVATCVRKASNFLVRSGIEGEVIVADNGSTDGSQDLALSSGAHVVSIADKGYGNALIGGINAAQGRFVIMADADDSYDFSELGPLVESLQSGNMLVIGNRFRGGIRAGAMPFLHRFIGNPLLSLMGRLFFSSAIGDFHCGLRGIDREAALKLGLQAPGMEFASEMIVKATLAGWRIGEVPATLSPTGRSRRPHLRSWRDGWRHLRFLLMMSPRWLMLYPGTCLIAIGVAAQIAIARGPIVVSGIGFDIHTMLYAGGAVILGVQLVLFSVLARAIGVLKNVLPMRRTFSLFLRVFTLERGILLGMLLGAGGLGLAVYSVTTWAQAHLAALEPTVVMRVAIPSVTLMLTGAEVIFSSFLLKFIDVNTPAIDPRLPVTLGSLIRGFLGPRLARRAGGYYRAIYVDLAKVAAALAAVIPRDTHLLDVGGGDGLPLNYLLSIRPDLTITTLDLAPVVGQWIEPCYEGKIKRLPRTSLAEFIACSHVYPNAILIADVMHHIPTAARHKFLESVAILLDRVPGLRVIVKDVEPGHWRGLLGSWSDRYITGDRNVSLISREGITRLFEEVLGPLRREDTDLFKKDGPNYAIVFYR